MSGEVTHYSVRTQIRQIITPDKHLIVLSPMQNHLRITLVMLFRGHSISNNLLPLFRHQFDTRLFQIITTARSATFLSIILLIP